MFWHLVLLVLSPLYAFARRFLPDDRARQILALRQQVLVLQRQVRKCPQFSRTDRLGVAQQFRSPAVVCDESPRFLIDDRDDKFTAYADGLVAAIGTRVISLPPHPESTPGSVAEMPREQTP